MNYNVKIGGMACEHCVAHVKEALESVGATNIAVSLENGTAAFEADCPTDKIKSAIEDEGYDYLG